MLIRPTWRQRGRYLRHFVQLGGNSVDSEWRQFKQHRRVIGRRRRLLRQLHLEIVHDRSFVSPYLNTHTALPSTTQTKTLFAFTRGQHNFRPITKHWGFAWLPVWLSGNMLISITVVTDTDLCPCGETQTMSHIVESCPLTDKTEWWLISATLCRWRRCFVADQLWLMKCIQEEDCSYSTPGPVSAGVGDRLRTGKPLWHTTSRPGLLTLSHPSMGRSMSTQWKLGK